MQFRACPARRLFLVSPRPDTHGKPMGSYAVLMLICPFAWNSVCLEDVRSCVRFGRGLNPLVGMKLQDQIPPQGEPYEEEYETE